MATESPTCFSQRVTVPSVTDSPSSGRVTSVAMFVLSSNLLCVFSGVCVQGLAGEGQVGLAEGLVMGRVGVHQRRHVPGVPLPVVDKLVLAYKLADEIGRGARRKE